ncbi:MAG: GH3 auxin-responsive promoter family protein [Bacteroidales bacterium]
MPFLNSIISWVTIKRLQQINWYKTNPQDIQNELLFGLIHDCRETAWGKEYQYDTIESPKDYQKRVPLSYYEDIEPYIERIRKGEQFVLWHSPIKWFAKSSGTTNDKSKFIPVSKESLEECHFRGARDTVLLYNYIYTDSNLWKGKTLALGGSHQISKFSVDSYFGDLSAILIQNMPFWSQFYRTPDLSLALMDEWEEKIEKIAQKTSEENVVALAGVPSWTMVLVKRILELTGASSILEIWPNLELFIHGGVSFEPYREQFKALIPKDSMRYMETYNASEGFFAIQDTPSTPDMLLMLDIGVFYEFIPIEQIHDSNPEALLLTEVELGQNYAIVISTNSGLWRYVIGDTVEFTSRYPYKIKITGRIKHFINAFGEELIIDNAERALAEASKQTHAKIREYTAAPVYMSQHNKGKHQWLIEFEQQPTDFDLFQSVLDATLQELNSDYEAKRYKSITLDNPDVQRAPDGTFYNWLKSKGKLGGQHKIPRLSNTREYIDEILSSIQ